jgi:hypothetical protein
MIPMPVLAVVGLAVLLLAVFFARGGPKKFLNKERQQLTLTKKEYISHDTLHLTFTLPKATPVLGLPTGKHFKIFAPNVAGKVAGEWNGREDMSADEPEIHRMYTPVTSDRDLGKVELVLKAYKGGVNENCELRPPCLQSTPPRPPAAPAAQCRRLQPLTPRPNPVPPVVDGGKMSQYMAAVAEGESITVSGPCRSSVDARRRRSVSWRP